MPFVQRDGCRIYYRLEGNFTRPLLILVHSLGADHGMWHLQMPRLLWHFRVLRLDLRGHGASDSPPGDYTIVELGRDVLAVAASAGYEKFFYCGLSLGGMVGQWLAADANSNVTRLVLANTSARMPDPGIFEARRRSVIENGMSSIAESSLQRSFAPRFLREASPSVDSHRFTLLANNPIGYAGCCAAIRDMDQVALLRRINMPVLVIGGEEDLSTPWVGNGDVLVQSIPDAIGKCFQAGHMSNMERPDLFTTALLDFLLTGTIQT